MKIRVALSALGIVIALALPSCTNSPAGPTNPIETPASTPMATAAANSTGSAVPTFDVQIPDSGYSGINPSQEFVAVDEEGNAYIADRSGDIVKLSAEGNVLATWNPEFSSNPGPEGIAVDNGGRIYVSDSGKRRIMVLSPDGNVLTSWEVPGDTEPRHSHLLAVDGEGNVYMTHYRSNRVLKYSSSGKLLAEWTSNAPTGVAADRNGNVYVVDHSHQTPGIQKYSATGQLLTRWGAFGSEPGNFGNPERVAVDKQGDVYVTDGDNHRVEKFSADGKLLAIWRTGKLYPAGIAVDRQGDIYVGGWNKGTADDIPYLIKISQDGAVVARWR